MSGHEQDTLSFSAPTEKLFSLLQWHDQLKPGEVKNSIETIHYIPASYAGPEALAVFCRHPFSQAQSGFLSNQSCCDDLELDRATIGLIRLFHDWINRDGIKNIPGKESSPAFVVRWWPREMIHRVTVSNVPSFKAQVKLNDHALECLELIRFAMLDEGDVAHLWEGSNEPFLAAGRIASGNFAWLGLFPEASFALENRTEIKARLLKFAREYVGLFRLASARGHSSRLTEKLGETILSFRKKYSFRFPRFSELAQRCLDLDAEMAEPMTLIGADEYKLIDRAASHLRHHLADASADLEHCIPAMINSFLPNLSVPDSALYFRDLN